MTGPMTPGIPLAIAVVAALVVAGMRAAARRPAVITGTHDRAVRQRAGPPRPPGRPPRAVEQAQHIFHELHADGRNALCVVCDSQYAA